MAVVLNLNKSKEKAVTKPKEKKLLKKGKYKLDITAAKIDNLGELKSNVDALKSTLKLANDKYAEALTNVSKAIEGLDADLALVAEGDEYQLDFGKKASVSKVTATGQELQEVLGDEVFYAICKCGIGDLKAYLTPTELEEVMVIEQKGSRSVKLTEKK